MRSFYAICLFNGDQDIMSEASFSNKEQEEIEFH